MRIAYVTETYPPEINGVALTVARTVRHLREHGHAVDLIRPRQAAGAPGADGQEWLTRGVPFPLYPELRFGLESPGALARRFEAKQTDLVHLATPGPLAWSALRAARRLGLAVSSDFRTNFHQYSRYYHMGVLGPVVLGILRQVHNRCDRTFVPTRALARELTAAGFRRLTVLGRGVDTALFRPERRRLELRESWGAADDTPVLLSVGRVAAEKNIRLALRAYRALRRRHADARLVVVGEGPLRGELALEHPDVRFMGVRQGEALAASYASADLFLFPSLTETFGNVTLEALASGLPVVAFDCAAAAEHVRPGAGGLLVPPGDEAGFEEAVCTLGADPARLESMRAEALAAGRAARWDDVLGRFERHLQDILDAHQAPSAAAAVVA
jgi:glycosyltransferase involved in cell wall biosynthesis